jgi:hypothetical protein
MTLLRALLALLAAFVERIPVWFDEAVARINAFALSCVCGIALLAFAFSLTVSLVLGSFRRK